jgi:hypothetical protein
VDLFGIDPDYTDGAPVDEFIERNRAGHDLAHIFLGSTARDAKEDADERIE